MSFDFNGHNVESLHEGVYAVINHYVNPVIGMIRADDRDGKPYSRERLLDAYSHAATDILAELQRLENERREERVRDHARWVDVLYEEALAHRHENLNDEPEAW